MIIGILENFCNWFEVIWISKCKRYKRNKKIEKEKKKRGK
jgi:hypothetical protein